MMSMRTSLLLLRDFSFFKCQDGKEISVKQEKEIPKSMGSTMSVFHHLHHMGSAGSRCAFLLFCGQEAVMEPDA